jgi:hypothetical protein
MFRRGRRNAVRSRRRDSCDKRDDGIAGQEIFGGGAIESAGTEHTVALRRDGVRRRCRLTFVCAAVRTADAVNRVQGRENNQHDDG